MAHVRLPPKADTNHSATNVRFVPKADSCTAAIDAALLQEIANFLQRLAYHDSSAPSAQRAAARAVQ
jgi:hypothetical protein